MLTANSTSKLFQPWCPDNNNTEIEDKNQSEFIDLPKVDSYQELEAHDAFETIRSAFLTEIKELKRLSHYFVGHQYDNKVDSFHSNLSAPPDHLKNSLLPLYREVRFHIHRLVSHLEKSIEPDAQAPVSHSPRSVAQEKYSREYIASVLHDCLTGIDLCPAGVHSRFASTHLNMEATSEGLDNKLFKIRNDQFSEYIRSFLFQQQREGSINIPEGMEIHWFNSLYSLYCDTLALPPVHDPLAPSNLSDDFIHLFLSSVCLHVNACNVLQRLADQWSEQIAATLQQLGASAWLKSAIEPAEMTADKTEQLESSVFKPINHLMGTTADGSLDLWTIADLQDDGTFRFDRYREKLWAFAANHFCGADTAVFTAIPGSGASNRYIGTIDRIYFWVFDNEMELHTDQFYRFESDNHITLQLSHLTTIDFSSWSDTTTHALLTQAVLQTNTPDEIASFFTNPRIVSQLNRTSQPLIEIISNQLTEKLLHNDTIFRETLYGRLCNDLSLQTTNPTSTDSLTWLINTPLLEPVLSELSRKSVDITRITDRLNSWQIAEFSENCIRETLTPENCQRLFVQALSLNQAKTLSSLVLSGQCDQLVNKTDDEESSPLGILAERNILTGLKYLLNLTDTAVNHSDQYGWTALYKASRKGHRECVRELLKRPDIHVNEAGGKSWTPLSAACRYGHLECVKLLLTAPDIQINCSTPENWTPLNIAARYGYHTCVEVLLKQPGILINIKNNFGSTPLNSAARSGHDEVVKLLLTADEILVDEKDSEGWSPLHNAIRSGHNKCVRELLRSKEIDLSEKNMEGCTPLGSAAQNNHWLCIRELLKAEGILVNEPDSEDRMPLDLAILSDNPLCVRELVAATDVLINKKDCNDLTPLERAITENKWECVRELLKSTRIQVNVWHRAHDKKPLNIAVDSGHHRCIRELVIAGGILINETDSCGRTPLVNAVKNGDNDSVRELIKSEKIDVNKRTVFGYAALHYAARFGYHECIRELMKAADLQINSKSTQGWTALLIAARFGNHESIRELIKGRNLQINERCAEGWTALCCATRNGHHESVRELLKAENILVNKKNGNGWTPLNLAARFGHPECVRELLASEEIQINIKAPYKRKTALMLAIKSQHQQCAKLLIQHDRTDINRVDLLLGTALTKARKKELTEIVDMLEADPRLNQPLNNLLGAVHR